MTRGSKTEGIIYRTGIQRIWGDSFMEQKIYTEIVTGILSALASQVTRIILYGSVARGTDSSESDVDIAVFVRSKLSPVMEDRLSDIVVDMNLKYDRVFSVIDIEESTYRKWRDITPFYQNVEKDGIILWTAA